MDFERLVRVVDSARFLVGLRSIMLAVAFGGSLIVRFWFGLSLGLSLLIFFVGWPLGGTLVTGDDDLPGGWSNPDGTEQPVWLEAPFWGRISAGVALAAAGAALDDGWRSTQGLVWPRGRRLLCRCCSHHPPVVAARRSGSRCARFLAVMKTLNRPVGPAELNLIAASGWKEFPPRLPEQPIFYPVLTEEYAAPKSSRPSISTSWASSES
jgi:hypothetical protein